jgi:hypothetical protein
MRNGGSSMLYIDIVDAATLMRPDEVEAFGVMAESMERKDLSSGFGLSLMWFITWDRDGALGLAVPT